MSILNRLADALEWESYYNYKTEKGRISKKDAAALREYIDKKEYLPVVYAIQMGEPFPIPKKNLVNKTKAGKKRVVYTFDGAENNVLKLMAFLLRKYDGIFSPNLYSFRVDSGVKKATERILRLQDLNGRYVYKADVSNYFNSVNIDLLLPELKAALGDDPALYSFFEGILTQPYAEYEGEHIREQKGIMAGVPVSGFLANLYLSELDRYFFEKRIPYMRYSDDIIVFVRSKAELEECREEILSFLKKRGLTVNPDKEQTFLPGEKWNFLGFSYEKGVIDVSDVAYEKLKGKLKRKTAALSRWAEAKGVDGKRAASALVKRFNAKLYDNPAANELTWTRWYFPVINTDVTLKMIDGYMQDCLRYLATGKRTKGRFNFRYEDMKALGYKSLVNEYYKFKKTSKENNPSNE